MVRVQNSNLSNGPAETRSKRFPWCATAPAIALRCCHPLTHRIKGLIGVSADVRLLDPDSVERSLGKARRVIDERPR